MTASDRWKGAMLAVALASAPLFADVVYLRGGGRLTGEIVEQTADAVIIDIGAGKMTVQMSTVVDLERGSSPLQEFRARASSIAANDVEAWRVLAQWAAKQGLEAQSDEAYSRVRAVLPNDPEANAALGLILHQGRWVTEAESYTARGFVEFEGAWMMPAERNAIIAERTAREEADRQALGKEIRESEARLREEEALEKAKDAEERAKRESNLPEYGDPVYWGWGYGPGSWPAQPGVWDSK